jgi:transposase InsO family protein
MAKAVGFQHVTTSAYHPQANGLVERFHRQLKAEPRARLCGTAWANHLAWVMLGLRAAPKEDSNESAAEVILGKKLVLQGNLCRRRRQTARTEAPAQPAVMKGPPFR